MAMKRERGMVWMKSIVIIHSNMEIGGAETSLIGLLNAIDYSKYSVDLFLLEKKGELLGLIPKEVNILTVDENYKYLVIPIVNIIKDGKYSLALCRIFGKLKAIKFKDRGYMTKHYSHKYAMKYLPNITKNYDLAISFIDPHFIMNEKIHANIKLSWLHTDFSRIGPDFESDMEMWNKSDFIVNVSHSCKKAFDTVYPGLSKKSIVIENILSKEFIIRNSTEKIDEMKEDGIKILSIGRFAHAKNFDNIPYIAQILKSKGLIFKWYIIGYGGEEQLIMDKIKEAVMEDYVIMLGKKENPYPYIKACDFYIQPSRYEGKAVTVREAQILNKPVIITDFETSSSQLIDGYDGVIVPMDNEGCANGIFDFINNTELQEKIIHNLKNNDYSNASEINKIYELMEEV